MERVRRANVCRWSAHREFLLADPPREDITDTVDNEQIRDLERMVFEGRCVAALKRITSRYDSVRDKNFAPTQADLRRRLSILQVETHSGRIADATGGSARGGPRGGHQDRAPTRGRLPGEGSCYVYEQRQGLSRVSPKLCRTEGRRCTSPPSRAATTSPSFCETWRPSPRRFSTR